MSSIALPLTTGVEPRRGEVDLARAAVRGDRRAFDELYCRHGHAAWRLASAVAGERHAAIAAVADGFARSLRAGRKRGAGGEVVRTAVLAGVYRSAIDHVRRAPADAGPVAAGAASCAAGGAASGGAASGADGADPVQASFVSLPERWRAAVWLREVEGMDTGRSAAVLGVPVAVATQLADRGQRALAARLEQAGLAPSADLGRSLRPVAGNLPAVLADVAAARWRRAVVVDPAGRLGPLLGERAQRTLAVAASGLLAFGLIGLGVLDQGATTPGDGAIAAGAAGRSGAGVSPPVALVVPAGALAGLGTPGAGGSFALTAADRQLMAAGAAAAAGHSSTAGSSPSAGGTGTATGSGTGSGGSPAGGSGANGGGGTSAGGGSGGGSTGSTGTSGGTKPIVSVPGVASVGTGNGSINVTAAPPSSGSGSPGASVTVCPDGISFSVLGITALSQCPGSSSPPTTLPLSPPTTLLPPSPTTTLPPNPLGGLGL